MTTTKELELLPKLWVTVFDVFKTGTKCILVNKQLQLQTYDSLLNTLDLIESTNTEGEWSAVFSQRSVFLNGKCVVQGSLTPAQIAEIESQNRL